MNKLTKEKILRINDVIERCFNEETTKYLKDVYDDLVWLYENHFLADDDDYRTASETYGLGTEEENMSTIRYIVDRWRCSFRVRWLIEVVNPDYVLFQGGV